MPLLKASRLLVCLAMVALAALATSATARAEAEDSAAVEKVTKLNKKAVDDYQNLNFEESRKVLRQAIEACAQSGLENHPVTARTYVHLGIVSFLGFKQKDEAIKQFRKALEIQPDIKLDKILATPEVQEVYDEAVEQHKEASATAKKPPDRRERGRGDRTRAGDVITPGQGDSDQGERRSRPGREEGRVVVQRGRRR